MTDIKSKLEHILSKGHNSDTITIYGVKYDVAELAHQLGVEYHSKKHTKPTKHTKIEDIEVNTNADMEQQEHSGHTEES